MKSRIYFAAILLFVPFFSKSQDKVKEKDVIGSWKMVIDINDDDEDDDNDVYEDRDVDESFLGHIIASGAKALVENILDEIDIRFEFLKNGRLEVYAMNERDDDDEDTRWYINSYGELIITDRDGHDNDKDDVWMLKDGKLVAYEKHGSRRLKQKNVYLVKMD